jgi:murein hydrolase activator
MKKSIKCFFLVFWGMLLFGVVYGQNRQELEKQRIQIIKDIEKASQKLRSTQKNKEQNLAQLKALEEKLNSRKKLIENLNYEVKLNDQQLAQNENTLKQLQDQHVALKMQYKKILRTAYLQKMAGSDWTYLLSSNNLNKLMLKWRYIQQFNQYTDQKLKEIQTITGEIQLKNEEIAAIKQKNMVSLTESNNNIALLQKEQTEKDKLVKSLSKEENNLLAKIKNNEKQREKLNTAIEKIIIAELAKAKEKDKTTEESTGKVREIDNSGFSKNKGALSWPVTKGNITGKFGTHPHPTLKNVDVSNNGVDFTIPGNTSVTCIYDGEVVGITNIPGFKNMVIIKHGTYYTVYSKLDGVSVSKDQKIKRGQPIGNVVAGEDGNAELHFELWKDKSKLNPQSWFNR